MKKILLCLMILFYINCAYAVNWQEGFYKNYIDVDSFAIYGEILDFWTKEYNYDKYFKSFDFYERKLNFALFHHQINCKNKTHALLRVLTYDKNNKPLKDLTPEYINFNEIIPGSKIDYYTTFCKTTENKD